MALDNVLFVVANNAKTCDVKIGRIVGQKLSDNGKPTDLYAVIKLAGCRARSLDEAIKYLAGLGEKLVKVSIPKQKVGVYSFQISPVMTGIDAATTLFDYVAPEDDSDDEPEEETEATEATAN